MNYKNQRQLKKELKRMSQMSFGQIKEGDLTDMNDIQIDQSLKPADRIISYLSQVKNPYFLKRNGLIIKIGFSDSGKTMQQCMEEYLMAELNVSKDQK